MLVSPDGDTALTKWFDNKPIMFLSTIYAAHEPYYCRRKYDKSLRQYIDVPRPEVVKEYNASMGGVDLTYRLYVQHEGALRNGQFDLFHIALICQSQMRGLRPSPRTSALIRRVSLLNYFLLYLRY